MKNNLQQSTLDSQLSASVPSGYKQSEVGVIPEDWEVVPLGNHFKFKNGLNKGKEFFGHGTPIVNYMDVFQHPHLKLRTIQGCVDVNNRELKAYEVRQGDVFFTRTSETVEEIGIAAVMTDEPSNTVFSGFILRGRPTDQSFDNQFKGFCFASRYFRQQVTARASYTTRALTNGRSLSMAFVAKPPLTEQRAIAKALSDMDALLEGLDRLIAKKRDLKQATMQALLTPPAKRVESGKLKVESDGSANSQLSSLKSPLKNVRLPGFEGEWEVKQLGDVGVFLKGSGIRKDDAQSGDLPCVRYGEIYTHHNDYVRYYNSWISRTVAVNAVLLKRGDILFAGSGETKGEIGKCVAFVDDCEAYAGGDIVILRSYETDPVFMGYYCNTVSIRRQKASKGQGDAVVHISASALASIELKLPTIPEQVAIAAVLTDMDTEIEALEQRRDKTADIKQAMMQELLTGKIRLVSGKLKVESGE